MNDGHDVEVVVKKINKWTIRHHYMVLGSLFVIGIMFLTDPDMFDPKNMPWGGSTVGMFVLLSEVVLGVTLLHISRKALMDYVNLEYLMNKAKETPEGAGMATIAVGLFSIAIAIIIASKL